MTDDENERNALRHLAFLDGRRAEMPDTLRDWCAVNSGSQNLDGHATMCNALGDAFAALGGEVEIAPSTPHEIVTPDGETVSRPVGDCLRIVKRPQAPVRVLLAGHMDTVFPADSAFQSDRMIDDDTMNAPGAADMKGGLLVMLRALEAVENSPFADRLGYEVLINADEEIGSHGSASLLVDAAARAHFACVYEPALADGTLAGARKGSGNFSLIVDGKSAHAGREHHLGRNAVVAAAEFAADVSTLTGGREGLTVNVARIEGGGPNNVVPDKAVARFNVRVERPDDADWASAEIAARVDALNGREGFAARLHGGFARPPKPMTPELTEFFELLKRIGGELGLGVDWKPTGGCCDGNNLAAAGLPVIDTLGVRGGRIHSADEFVKLDSLEERAKLSALLLMRIAAGDVPVPGRAREAA
ncbi:MAG: hydrolase [Parvularculaceae bacterium]